MGASLRANLKQGGESRRARSLALDLDTCQLSGDGPYLEAGRYVHANRGPDIDWHRYPEVNQFAGGPVGQCPCRHMCRTACPSAHASSDQAGHEFPGLYAGEFVHRIADAEVRRHKHQSVHRRAHRPVRRLRGRTAKGSAHRSPNSSVDLLGCLPADGTTGQHARQGNSLPAHPTARQTASGTAHAPRGTHADGPARRTPRLPAHRAADRRTSPPAHLTPHGPATPSAYLTASTPPRRPAGRFHRPQPTRPTSPYASRTPTTTASPTPSLPANRGAGTPPHAPAHSSTGRPRRIPAYAPSTPTAHPPVDRRACPQPYQRRRKPPHPHGY